MTAQQIFEKTEELIQAIKDQPTEVLVDMWKKGSAKGGYECVFIVDTVVMELKRRDPDKYYKWACSIDVDIDIFLT